MARLRPVLAVAGKDLRQRMRDRSALVLGFVAPLAIAFLMSAAFGNTQYFSMTAGYADADHGPVAAAFATTLRSPALSDLVRVRSFADAAAARRAVDTGAVDIAFLVPAGFSAAVTSTEPAAVVPAVRVVGGVDHALAAQVGRALAESFAAHLAGSRLSVATAVAAGAPLQDVPALAAAASAQGSILTVARSSARDEQMNTVSYMAPAMGIFFVLFAIGFGARGYVTERRDGTVDRIAAAPVPRGTVVAGKALATLGYALASLTTMAVVSTLAFGASWGSPLGVALLIVGMSVSVVALTGLVIALAGTERQAEGIASVLTFALALLGGNFTFLSAAPPLLRRLATYTPNGWALRGFTDLATGAGTGAVTRPLLAMLGISVLLAVVTVALVRHRRLA